MTKYLAYRQGVDRRYEAEAKQIFRFVRDELGLDPNETDFVFTDQNEINVFAGMLFPVALPHWSRGRDILLNKGNRGIRIYEIVFNTNPALALVSNTALPGEVKMIFAHVYGHTHIFKHGAYESKDTDVVLRLRYALERYYEYEKQYGTDRLDALIDFVHALRFTFSAETFGREIGVRAENTSRPKPILPQSLARFYPAGEDQPTKTEVHDDILGYILRKAERLEDWEKDIIRAESDFVRHIYRRAKTKFVHEGFATWTHVKTLLGLFKEDDFFQSLFLDASIHPDVFNPYWLGFKIFHLLEQDGLDVVRLATVTSDEELFYAYLDENMWAKILLSEFGGRNRQDVLEALGSFETLKARLLGYSFATIPRVFVDEYDTTDSDNPHWHILQTRPRKYTGPLTYPLKLTSDTPLDMNYAVETIRAIAEVWRGPVYVRYRRES